MLFGIIFIRLELVQLSSGFFLELGIVAALVTIVRVFWYNDGEDRAMREQGIKTLKTNYATLVESTITSQDDLDAFVKEMNELNRER
jgi:membrane-bound ClpP family serine protease